MSIAKAQKGNLEFISSIGANREDFVTTGKMTEVELIMADYAKKFINAAQRNLRAKHKIDTGALMDIQFEVSYMGRNYVLTVGYEKGSKAEEYWDFVNKGVAGVGKSLNGSPYKFKTKYANKKMALSILLWIRRNSIKPTDKYTIKGLEEKRKSIRKIADEAKSVKKLAYAISSKTKREGIEQTNYFDNALKLFNSAEFQKDIAEAVGYEVQIAIVNSFKPQ